MKNYVQEGKTLTVTAAAAFAAGAVVLVGKMIGFASGAAAIGEEVEVAVEGVFEADVASAADVSVGDTLYWDVADSEFNKDATGNTKAGYATTAAGVGITTVNIKLTPGAA